MFQNERDVTVSSTQKYLIHEIILYFVASGLKHVYNGIRDWEVSNRQQGICDGHITTA
jgi:hypothetical protein